MRLWGYYALHTFVNGLKKLLKTWLGFFLIIMVFGFVIGLGAGLVANNLSKNKEENEIMEEEEQEEEETPAEERRSYFAENGITKESFTEFIASAVILGYIILMVLNSKNAGSIFKQGDVVMLFSAPIKPQSVMLFRLIFTLGMQLVASLYMIFQLPNLIVNAGLPVFGAISILVGWFFLLLASTLLQVTFYTLANKNEKYKKVVNFIVYALIVLIAGGFLVYNNMTDKVLLRNAVDFLTNKNTYFVPFWGWIRGLIAYALAGNVPMFLMFTGLNIVGFIALIAVIWNINADFYEEAIGQVEKMAEAVEASKRNGTAKIRTKERSDRIKRDGIGKGNGANVFFYKTLYNRNRFAFLHFFTKTMGLYILAAGIVAYLARNVKNGNGFLFVGALISLIVFFRTLGNPLQADTSKEFFVMIPEKASKKLFWSLLGGEVCCLFDIFIPLVGAGIYLGTNISTVLVWLLFALSIDFYGTTVGTFIGVSIPVDAGEKLKQMVQIMFIYFGVVPAVVFIVVGINLKMVLLFGVLGALFNMLCGFAFFALTPEFLEHGNK